MGRADSADDRARRTLRGAPANEGGDVYPDQIAGRRVPNKEAYNARGQSLLSDWAVWDDFKLVQPNADGFYSRQAHQSAKRVDTSRRRQARVRSRLRR